MFSRRTIAALALMLILAGACSSSDSASDQLDGTEYWSTSVTQNGEPFALVDGTRIVVSFDADNIRASAGCNSISGAVSIDNGQLRLPGQWGMTQMGCGDQAAQEDLLIELLSGMPAVTIDGDMLRLETATAAIDFIDAAIANPDLSFQGTTWEIDGFLSGGTASSFATDVRGTVRIVDDTMQLFDSCATVELTLEIGDAEIVFDPVGLPPAEDCDAPPGYRQSIYTAFSRGSLAYTVDGTNLTLATPDNVGFTLKALE